MDAYDAGGGGGGGGGPYLPLITKDYREPSFGERIESFLPPASSVTPGWEWIRYAALINPFFYFNKFVEQPVVEEYGISPSLTIGTVGTLGSLAYGGVKSLSFAKNYYFPSTPAETATTVVDDVDVAALRGMGADLQNTGGRVLDIGGLDGLGVDPQHIPGQISLNPTPYGYCDQCGSVIGEYPVTVKGFGEAAPFVDESFSVIKARNLPANALNEDMFSSMSRLLEPGGSVYITTAWNPQMVESLKLYFRQVELVFGSYDVLIIATR